MIAAGYYTIQERDSDNEPTVCRVDEDEDEVEIMNYTPGYPRGDVFEPDGRFIVLAGPWELPR